jgi:hypothetical protein
MEYPFTIVRICMAANSTALDHTQMDWKLHFIHLNIHDFWFSKNDKN